MIGEDSGASPNRLQDLHQLCGGRAVLWFLARQAPVFRSPAVLRHRSGNNFISTESSHGHWPTLGCGASMPTKEESTTYPIVWSRLFPGLLRQTRTHRDALRPECFYGPIEVRFRDAHSRVNERIEERFYLASRTESFSNRRQTKEIHR